MPDSNTTIEREVEIINEQGLHARPVMRIYDIVMAHACEVRVAKGEQVADGRSVMDMMLLEAPKGSRLKLMVCGDGAAQVLDAIAKLIECKFYEDPPFSESPPAPPLNS